MMPTPFAANGVDFDDLFDPYVTGTVPADTGYKMPGGADLAGRYAPLSFGTKRADVGYSVDGEDVTNLWAAKGTALYVTLDVVPASLETLQESASPPVTATCSFTYGSNGVASWVSVDPGSSSGNWIAPGGAGAGSPYDLRFTQTATSGTGTLTGDTLGVWHDAGSSRGLTLTATRNSIGVLNATRTILVEARLKSNGVIVASHTIDLRSEATVSN